MRGPKLYYMRVQAWTYVHATLCALIWMLVVYVHSFDITTMVPTALYVLILILLVYVRAYVGGSRWNSRSRSPPHHQSHVHATHTHARTLLPFPAMEAVRLSSTTAWPLLALTAEGDMTLASVCARASVCGTSDTRSLGGGGGEDG
jgi:hypothetical protein